MTLQMRVTGIECKHYDKALVRIHFAGEEPGPSRISSSTSRRSSSRPTASARSTP
jgi:hypothetical protein